MLVELDIADDASACAGDLFLYRSNRIAGRDGCLGMPPLRKISAGGWNGKG